MPRKRPTLTQRQAVLKAAREAGTFTPAELPAKVACTRCGSQQWPDASGEPRYHLRAARLGDDAYSAEFPAMTECS